MKLDGVRTIYDVLQTEYQRRDDGLHYIPVIIKEAVDGYSLTDWDYGTDYERAQDAIAQLNYERGYDYDQYHHIKTSSIFPGYAAKKQYPRPETDDRHREPDATLTYKKWREMSSLVAH